MTATTTDPTLAGLLTRVLAEPDDDFARLAYADRYDELAGAVPCGKVPFRTGIDND